jgi:hypothetical protein
MNVLKEIVAKIMGLVVGVGILLLMVVLAVRMPEQFLYLTVL